MRKHEARTLLLFVLGINLTVNSSAVLADQLAQPVQKENSSSTGNFRSTESSGEGIQFPVDHDVDRLLERAEQAIREKADWLLTTRALQSVLERKQDVFMPAQGRPGQRVSARSEANRMLGTITREGLDVYELQYGARARNLLTRAKTSGDPRLLAKAAQLYAHTVAGVEASELLGTYHLDRGRPLAAALCYLPLLADEHSSLAPLAFYKAAVAFRTVNDRDCRAHAERAWERLAGVCGSTGVKMEDETIPLGDLRKEFEQVKPPEPTAIADWPMFRGGVSRSVIARGEIGALREQWQSTDLPKDPDLASKYWVEKSLSHEEYRSDSRMHAFFPIAAGGKVIARGFSGVQAVDPATGKLCWTAPMRAGFDALASDADKQETVQRWFEKYRQVANEDIVYQNSLVGSLSSDGARVYAVDDLPMPPHPDVTGKKSRSNLRLPMLPSWARQNQLVALDISSGKVVWQCSGADRNAGQMADDYFLGPPLPLHGKLYALTEKDAELRLLCLDPARGECLWTQALAFVADRFTWDTRRRLHAAHLAYGDGILVCPTNAGAVIAVDPLTGTLRWAFRYSNALARRPEEQSAGEHLRALKQDWKMAAPMVAEGKVIFASPEGDSIYCLRLADGAVLWQSDRSNDVYLAGVFHGKVLLVGVNYCRALRMDDGVQLWQVGSDAPSGQGIAVGSQYHLPLEKGAIATLDVERGTFVAYTVMPRGERAGNLLFAGEHLVSRTKTAVHCYSCGNP